MGDRQGVEVNYCPTCRGVWIDHGGLDKIIDRAAAISSRPPIDRAAAASSRYAYESEHNHDRHDYDDEHGHEGHRRRKSFLSNLFD
jgi:uncharacterized protein